MSTKPRIAVHKFSSCDGCQLAFLNMGENLLALAERVDIIHFAEAGPVAEDAPVDIAFIEGSVVTKHDQQRIQDIRNNSRYLITIGACATSGGIQALKNLAKDATEWPAMIYGQPRYIDSLDESGAVADYVKVDFELWGCPINSDQVVELVNSLLRGVSPVDHRDKVCLSCKQQQVICTLGTQGKPCLGPVTRAGCGALCPSFGRDCFGCYGPSENSNTTGLANRFSGLGLMPDEIKRRFALVHASAEENRNVIFWESGDE